MPTTSQQRAIKNYRKRLTERGVGRFEVIGRKDDQELIRSLAKRLTEHNAEAARIRAVVKQSIVSKPAKKGGIVAALLRSPLAGSDIKFERAAARERKLDL